MFFLECSQCGRKLKGEVEPLHCPCTYTIDSFPREETEEEPVVVSKPVFREWKDYECERIMSCASCLLRIKIDCGKLKDMRKGSEIMGGKGVPNPKAKCPIGRWQSQL